MFVLFSYLLSSFSTCMKIWSHCRFMQILSLSLSLNFKPPLCSFVSMLPWEKNHLYHNGCWSCIFFFSNISQIMVENLLFCFFFNWKLSEMNPCPKCPATILNRIDAWLSSSCNRYWAYFCMQWQNLLSDNVFPKWAHVAIENVKFCHTVLYVEVSILWGKQSVALTVVIMSYLHSFCFVWLKISMAK